MQVDIVTIFPEYLAPLELSLIGRARQSGRLRVGVHDLRRWTQDAHRTVDDTPYGGGPGMVMRPQPWGLALDELIGPEQALSTDLRPTDQLPADQLPDDRRPVPDAQVASVLVVPTPAGEPFTQAMAHELASAGRLLFACGRYEGIDQRVMEHAATRIAVREVSIGDYVLFGGEVAVLVILEAVTRLLPGVLGNADSLVDESHANGLLEAPVYTKPATWRGLDVPEVLRSGDHARIARWRHDQAVARTWTRRPDLATRRDQGGVGE